MVRDFKVYLQDLKLEKKFNCQKHSGWTTKSTKMKKMETFSQKNQEDSQLDPLEKKKVRNSVPAVWTTPPPQPEPELLITVFTAVPGTSPASTGHSGGAIFYPGHKLHMGLVLYFSGVPCCRLFAALQCISWLIKKHTLQRSCTKIWDYSASTSLGLQCARLPQIISNTVRLKGLSSENYEGSKVVSIERSCFKHVVLGIYFNFFSVSIL